MSGTLLQVAVLGLLACSACSTIRLGDSRGSAAPRPEPAVASPAPAAAPSPAVGWRVIGSSVEGRPLRVLDVGRGTRRVLWIGGIHGDEVEGKDVTAHLPAEFLAEPGLADVITLSILEDVNPDGRVHGTRRNARGVDLNRNYPARNYRPGNDRGSAALCEPEALALHRLLQDLKPELVMVAHSWGRRPTGPAAFVNFDGPAQAAADVFSGVSGYPVVPSEDIHGTPGSLGSLVGIDMGIPILTIEYERGRDPARCWEETRRAILAVLRGLRLQPGS